MEPLRQTSLCDLELRDVSPVGEPRKAGVKMRVLRQPLKLVEILLSVPGEIFTREELRRRVWPIRRKVLVMLIRLSTLLSRSSGVG